MGSLELSLTCRQSTMKPYIPKTISEFLAEVSLIINSSERLSKLDDYVNRLQDEMKKIDAFKRELPLCMLLITDALAIMKGELMQCKKSSTEPILEEFIPLKKISNDLDEKAEAPKDEIVSSRDKMNWMSSVQLWNSDNLNSCPDIEFSNNKKALNRDNKRRVEEENNRPVNLMDDLFQSSNNRTVGSAFMPFKGYTDFPVMTVRKEDRGELPGAPVLSLSTPGIKNGTDDMESRGLNSISSCSGSGSSSAANCLSNSRAGQQRKQRRCWSPELHRRFVNALQQLGGAQVATPKQIRDLMQVDGLSNDEVKSHLQKYRLHTRKVPPTTNISSNQPVVLGGQWISHEQHGESSKQSNSQSGSPQGPLQLAGSSRGTSMTRGNSIEDEDDEKSESHSWKSRIHSCGRDDV
ncbi:myb family transcription factor EFM-like [Olea europaea subsp. europaea]|uniref:Myb family transcription factor EFM-like n=1 Tax=Olea europaea subsp. europaea TaxID=158383 RepID=A0A8S0URG6_OLEEU|nr:myb family transcription factor EFM-like [Olea europaea subsp. europaea]